MKTQAVSCWQPLGYSVLVHPEGPIGQEFYYDGDGTSNSRETVARLEFDAYRHWTKERVATWGTPSLIDLQKGVSQMDSFDTDSSSSSRTE